MKWARRFKAKVARFAVKSPTNSIDDRKHRPTAQLQAGEYPQALTIII